MFLQLRQLEEKSRADLGVLEDMQEFTRARAKLELEHAQSVQVSEQLNCLMETFVCTSIVSGSFCHIGNPSTRCPCLILSHMFSLTARVC